MSASLPTRPRRPIVITATMAGLAVTAALGISACSGGSASSSSPASAAPAAPAAPRHPDMMRGTISAENANTWTVTSAKGVAYTVNITPTTAFGTKKTPATAQSFPVGSQVVVAGKPTGTTIDATRIAAPPNRNAKSAPSSAPGSTG